MTKRSRLHPLQIKVMRHETIGKRYWFETCLITNNSVFILIAGSETDAWKLAKKMRAAIDDHAVCERPKIYSNYDERI